VVGIDDFAFKKRFTYETIIVDEKTHQTVAVLVGRDGTTLKEWLKSNKHIKTVTRDRASAYAKAISEVLPDTMQIADRFHLHQDLLKAITKALGREIPSTIAIPKEEILDKTPEEGVAKNQGQAWQESHDENSKDAVVISFDENPEESKKNAQGCG